MTALDALTSSRRKLIIHRTTRAIAEKLQREDVVALYSFMYQEATLHRAYYKRMPAEELKKTWETNSNMLVHLLHKIQKRRGFDWLQTVTGILREEGVANPTEEETSAMAVVLIGEALV